ncbi:hypothetical protein UlMin_045274 [Ulmus minor]
MAEESAARPIRLMNFVSEEQLDVAKKTRGERVEDGTAQRDRPLYEILKENKDKKDAEFNERLKHRPPKALDEDETEFLDRLELTRREYEQRLAEEEALQLRTFHAAMAAQSMVVHELKETPPAPAVQEQKSAGKRDPPARPLGMMIKVKPQPKKAKLDVRGIGEQPNPVRTHDVDTDKSSEPMKAPDGDNYRPSDVAKTGLVSYSDDSDDDD